MSKILKFPPKILNRDIYVSILIVIFSIFLTLLFWTVLPKSFRVNESSDYISYYEPVARNFLSSGRLLLNGEFPVFYPPGFPIIISFLLGIAKFTSVTENIVISIFQLIGTSLSGVLLYYIARQFFGKFTSFITSVLWLTYPFFLWITKQPNSEIPFMIGLFFSFYLLVKGINSGAHKNLWFFFSGCTLGLSTLIRPVSVFLPVFIALVVLFRKFLRPFLKRVIFIFVFILGFLLVIFPWELSVYNHTGKVVLISDNGSTAMRGGLVFALAEDSYKQPVSVPPDVKDFMYTVHDNYNELNSNKKIISFLFEYFIREPISILKLFFIKALRSWFATDRQSYETVISIIQLPYILLILFGTFLGIKKGEGNTNFVLLIWIAAIYFWLMNMLVTSTLRYMIPSLGLLFLLTAYVFEILIHRIKFARKTRHVEKEPK